MPSLARNRSSGGSSGSRHDRRREKAAVPVAPRRVPFLDPCEVEEGLREVVAVRALPPLHLLPGGGVVGNVVAETEIAGADRVEHPAGAPLDPLGDQGPRPRTSRAAWASAGPGSSRAKTAST